MKKHTILIVTSVLVIVWAWAKVTGNDTFLEDVYTNIYAVIALFGGIFGLVTAKAWGGFKSVLGKALICLSSGLLLTVGGQLMNSYYVVVQELEELPYPSVAEIGFFGAVILYIVGALYIAKAMRLKNKIKSTSATKLLGLSLIPIAMVLPTVYIFATHYETAEATTAQLLLDFAYPIGQSIYAVIAVMALLYAKSMFGGRLQKATILLLVAFVVQYVADQNFVYQILYETWQNGQYGDFLYMIAYALMAYSIQMFRLTPGPAESAAQAKSGSEEQDNE